MDCVSKSITFTKPGGLSFKFQYEPTSDAFLTTCLPVIESTRAENTLANIMIVQDFEDVFRDILGLPSKKEIDLCIEMVSGTLSFSKTSYRMAPTEMLELKRQV